MRYITHTLPVLALGFVLVLPAAAAAQSQQQVDDLRRRVDEVERQLFQQRLAVPVSPQGRAVERLQARLDQLEREITSERVSRMAASISSAKPEAEPGQPSREGASAARPGTLEARVAELEAQRAADAKTIEALAERITKLEKAVIK